MSRQKNYKLIFAVAILALAIFSTIIAANVLAAPSCLDKCDNCKAHPLLEPWPASPFGGAKLDSCSKMGDLVKFLYGWGVSLGGIAVFISLVIAGFEYITSIGNPGKMKDAVSRIESAAIGLALLLGSWAIFNIINPNITTIKNTFDIMDSSSAFTVCSSKNSCCDTVKNPGCENNWNCCRPDDYNCMKCQSGEPDCKQMDTTTRPGYSNGDCCCINDACQSNYCNPTTSKCDVMPTICMKALDKSASGCDYVRFYKAVNFDDTDYVEIPSAQFNSNNFAHFKESDHAWAPQSFQAFKYEYDDKGNANKAMPAIPCGSTGCGCAVVLCLQMDAGGNSKCASDLTEQNSTQPMPAYETNFQNTRIAQAFVIDDETKKSGATQAIDSIGTNLKYIWSLFGK